MSRSPARRRRSWPLAVAGVALWAACGNRLSDEDAIRLVRHYNERNVVAFRTGDARITEPYTGEVEGRRLLGLIGVRLDQKRTLDAQLLDFEVRGVTRRRDEIVVGTRERWHWVERRIGTGEPVDLDSTDRYAMRYRIANERGRWVVAETEFAEPPHVGRPWTTWGNVPRDLHGLPPEPAAGPPALPSAGPGPAPEAAR